LIQKGKKNIEKVQSFFCGLVVEEKACWLRRNPAFVVVKTDFKNQKSKKISYLSIFRNSLVCLDLPIEIL